MAEYYNITNGNIQPRFSASTSLQELIEKNNDTQIILNVRNDEENLEETLSTLFSTLQGTKIKCEYITIEYDEDYIDDPKKLQQLERLATLSKEKNVSCYINLNDTSAEAWKFFVAKAEVDNFVNYINNMTFEENGVQVPLSPAEKFVAVYSYAANRIYNESENFFSEDMRNWVGVLTGNEVICSGYASLLKCLCDRVFDKNELICVAHSSNVFKKSDGELLGAHANNLIFLKDDKYGINGCYYADSCWGSPKNENGDTHYEFCLIPLNKIAEDKFCTFEFQESALLFNQNDDNDKLSNGQKVYDALYSRLNLAPPTVDRHLVHEQANAAREQYLEKSRADATEKRNLCYEILTKEKEDSEMRALLETPLLTRVPNKEKDKHTEFAEIELYLDDLNINSLSNLDKEILRKYNSFYKANTEIFDNLKERAKAVGLQVESTVEQVAIDCALHNEPKTKYFDVFDNERELLQKARENIINTINDHKSYINAPEIDKLAFYNGFKAVAQLRGLTDEHAITEYADKHLKTKEQNDEKRFVSNEKSSEISRSN